MQERIINFITQNSNVSPDRLHDLMMQTGEMVMDVGTIIDGEQAVKEGIIDRLGSLSDAIEELYSMIEEEKDVSVHDAER